MNVNFQSLIPDDFSDDSRVWIYQCSRSFTIDEVIILDELLTDFSSSWKSHGAPVKGFAKIFFGQFIVIMADEKATGVSGCSTDSSVKVIKSIEQDHKVHLFQREDLAFIAREHVLAIHLSKLNEAFEAGIINEETLYFNNTVPDKYQLLNNWIIPLRSSWLAKRFAISS